MAWWETLFDDRYLQLFGPLASAQVTQQQVDGIVAYLDLQPGDSVLDLACGYGRLTIPLAERGLVVTGLDLSETLLGQARAAAADARVQVTWHKGDMRDIPWRDSFDGVINVFSSFGYFDDETENRRVLSGVARALKPGGRFLIDVVNRDWRVCQRPERYWFEVGELIVLAEPWLNPVTGRSGETWRWLEEGQWQSLEFDTRLYTATELRTMVEAAGLAWHTVYGGWEREEFNPQSKRIVALAERPATHNDTHSR